MIDIEISSLLPNFSTNNSNKKQINALIKTPSKDFALIFLIINNYFFRVICIICNVHVYFLKKERISFLVAKSIEDSFLL